MKFLIGLFVGLIAGAFASALGLAVAANKNPIVLAGIKDAVSDGMDKALFGESRPSRRSSMLIRNRYSQIPTD